MAPTKTRTVSAFPAHSHWSTPLFVALVVALAAMISVLEPNSIPHDVEELYNAAHARLLQVGHSDKWQTLQYRGHCGGCTHNALIGSGLFSMFGHSLFSWKLVPVLFSALLGFSGAFLLNRTVGPLAAGVFGLLIVLSPPTFLELSMTSWGNHFESGVAAVAVLAVYHWYSGSPSLLRAAALGFAVSWSLWIGFSSVFIVFGLALALWRRTPLKHGALILAAGCTVGVLWSLQATQTTATVFDTIYQSGESHPQLTRIPSKLWSLFGPRQLVALFGMAHGTGGWIGGWASAASGLIAVWVVRKHVAFRPILLFSAAFLAVYSVVRFTVWAPPAPEIAPPGSMRYAAPIYGLFFLTLALGVGMLWNQGKRSLALLLVMPSIAVGVATRVAGHSDSFPDSSVFDMAAPDFEYSRDQLAYLFTVDEHQTCTGTEPDHIAFHAFGAGWTEAKQVLDHNEDAQIDLPSVRHYAALEGTASALLSQEDGSNQAGPFVLLRILGRIPTYSNADQRAVVAAAAWRRDWVSKLPEHGPRRIDAWNKRIQGLPIRIQEGLTEAFGRRWAHDTTPWRQPARMTVPNIEGLNQDVQAWFWAGFAEGIGERLGPEAQNIAARPDAPHWTDRMNRGIQRRWLSQSR